MESREEAERRIDAHAEWVRTHPDDIPVEKRDHRTKKREFRLRDLLRKP